MKLNCKVGDLAVIVKSTLGQAGKIVRCLEMISPNTDVGGGSFFKEPAWRIDRCIDLVSTKYGVSSLPFCMDSILRPLRDSDEPDETLAWAGKPQEVKA